MSKILQCFTCRQSVSSFRAIQTLARMEGRVTCIIKAAGVPVAGPGAIVKLDRYKRTY